MATIDREAEQRQIAKILDGLGSGSRQQAFADFLECYSPLILQVVRLFEADPDDALSMKGWIASAFRRSFDTSHANREDSCLKSSIVLRSGSSG